MFNEGPYVLWRIIAVILHSKNYISFNLHLIEYTSTFLNTDYYWLLVAVWFRFMFICYIMCLWLIIVSVYDFKEGVKKGGSVKLFSFFMLNVIQSET